MPDYIPSTAEWVRNQVELYERTNGAEGTTLRDTGLPVIIVTNTGHRTGSIRKTPLMRVKSGNTYVLVGSVGGGPKDPEWVHNLRAHPDIELRDLAVVRRMRVREVRDESERSRLWAVAVAAYPPYAEYAERAAAFKIVSLTERDAVLGVLQVHDRADQRVLQAALDRVVVGDRGAALQRARRGDRARREQQGLAEAGLAAARRADQGQGADGVHGGPRGRRGCA